MRRIKVEYPHCSIDVIVQQDSVPYGYSFILDPKNGSKIQTDKTYGNVMDCLIVALLMCEKSGQEMRL